MTTLCTAYGLTIASELHLPELLPGAGDPAVTIRLGAVARQPDEVAEAGNFVRAGVDEAALFATGIGAFLVCRGRAIVVEPAPGVDPALLRTFLLGPALAVLLQQRRILTLYASAVEIEGAAVAFIGWKGNGKSTTAAALQARGHRLLTDDILALDLAPLTNPTVYPGFPQIKLHPDTAALVAQPEALPRLHAKTSKLVYRSYANFSPAPLPLDAIFVLDEGPAPALEPVAPQAALLALIKHAYASRFLKTADATTDHFRQSRRLCRRVPVYRLQRPCSLQQLPHVVRLVEAEVTRRLHPVETGRIIALPAVLRAA